MDAVADLAHLAVGDRLARAGISADQAAALAALDARIVEDAPTATTASVERLARWLRAGSPAADVRRLQFEGADSVRAMVAESVGRLPPPIAWHALEFVEWIEVGRGNDGSFSVVGPARAPTGDSPHRIKLSGSLPDERIREVIPHELGHALHATVCEFVPYQAILAMPMAERHARALLIGRDLGMGEFQLAERLADEELLAECTAAAWGWTRPPLRAQAMRRRQRFLEELADAAELVPSIERACGRRRTP